MNICSNSRQKQASCFLPVLIVVALCLVTAIAVPMYFEMRNEKILSMKCQNATIILTKIYRNIQDNILDNDLINLNWNTTEDVIKELSNYVKLSVFKNPNVAQLTNGMIIEVKSVSDDCTSVRGETEWLKAVCATITVDVNSNEKPNKFGEDIFYFYLTRYGVLPAGSPADTFSPLSECANTRVGCTAWVISKGNQSYKRKKVSWKQ